MHLYLVRHTEYYNPKKLYAFHHPFSLSRAGIKHAERIGRWFVENNLENTPIYSSPISRCVETSKIVSDKTNSEVVIDERLIEVPCPNLQGKPKLGEESWILEEDDPSRESRDSVLKRMLEIYTEKVKENKDCIFVSHGDPTTFLYYHLENRKLPKYLWDPKNRANVVNKGMILDITIENNKVLNISTIMV